MGTHSNWQLSLILITVDMIYWPTSSAKQVISIIQSFSHSFLYSLLDPFMAAVSPRIHNTCIVIIWSALCNTFSKPSGSSGWRGGRSKGFAAKEGEREWREEGGELEKTWDIKGNLGWENENLIGEGYASTQVCAQLYSCKGKKNTNRMFVLGRQSETVKQDGWYFLISSWMQHYRDVDEDSQCT